jgi:hypothetical protein
MYRVKKIVLTKFGYPEERDPAALDPNSTDVGIFKVNVDEDTAEMSIR